MYFNGKIHFKEVKYIIKYKIKIKQKSQHVLIFERLK